MDTATRADPASLTTVWVVAARETYEHVRSPLTLTLVLVCAVLTAVAIKVRIGQWRENVETVSHLRQERDRQRSAGALTGAQVATSLRVIRPAESLSVLAAGSDARTPRYWDFGPSGLRTGATPSPSTSSDPIDLELLIRVIMGLLASTLAVDSIAGQRDRGELLALLGQSVRHGAVLLGKLLGAGATLGLALLVAVVVALTTSYIESPSLVSADFVVTLLMIAGAGLLYCLVWIAIGFLISSLVRWYSVAWSVTFAIWTVCALVAVNGGGAVAQAVAPVRSAQAEEFDRERVYQAAVTRMQDDIGDAFAAALGGISVWPDRQDDVRLTTEARARIEPMWLAQTAALRAELDERDRAARARQRTRDRIDWTLTTLNPAAAFLSAAANLAATGDAVMGAWDVRVAGRQARLDRVLFDDRPKVYAHVPYLDPVQHVQRRLVVTVDRRAPPALQDLPVVELDRPTARQRLRGAAVPLLALAGYAVTLMAAAAVAFQRLRP